MKQLNNEQQAYKTQLISIEFMADFMNSVIRIYQ